MLVNANILQNKESYTYTFSNQAFFTNMSLNFPQAPPSETSLSLDPEVIWSKRKQNNIARCTWICLYTWNPVKAWKTKVCIACLPKLRELNGKFLFCLHLVFSAVAVRFYNFQSLSKPGTCDFRTYHFITDYQLLCRIAVSLISLNSRFRTKRAIYLFLTSVCLMIIEASW